MTKRKRPPNSSDRLKKAQLSLYLEPEKYQELKALSERTGVPQQVYLRGGLAYILQINDLSTNGTAPSTRSQRNRRMTSVTGKAQPSRHK